MEKIINWFKSLLGIKPKVVKVVEAPKPSPAPKKKPIHPSNSGLSKSGLSSSTVKSKSKRGRKPKKSAASSGDGRTTTGNSSGTIKR